MSQQVIKKTQEMLGKYVSKPPLSEKLLGKPPFRYLHDIINVIIKDHGFLEGLYTEHELSSDNIKDKDAKIAFLQKWIDATSLALGEELNVRPSKIVAGHEADNTNLLLQAVAKGLDKKIDSSEAVKKVLSKSGKGSKKEKSDSKKDKSSKSKPKAPTGGKESPKKASGGNKTPNKELSSSKKVTSPTKNDKSKGAATALKKDSKSSEKGKSKEKKETSKTKGGSKESKTEKEKKEKEVKMKPKSKTQETQNKTKKAEPSVDTGKENDPPVPTPPVQNEVENAVSGEALVNGETDQSFENEELEKSPETLQNTQIVEQEKDDFFATADEVPSQPQSLLPKSAGNLRMDVENMEGLDPEQEPNEETFEGETETLIPQEGLSNDGPSSLPITDGGSNQDTSLHGSEINSQPQNDENNENNIEDSTTRPNSGNVDVASVKEMSPNDPERVNGEFLNGTISNDPVDSGVGSLESPKVSGKGESLPNTAEMKARSPPVPIPPTPGPRPPPLKAYHPDLQEEEEGTSSPIGNQMENKIDEPPERPKTGMSIRPRTGRKSARPPSARPPPPKARERREIPEELPRPPTGKPVPNVILDSDQNNENLDDDDDNFTVGTSRPILDEENEHNVQHSKDPSLEKDKQELLEGDQDAKGILVAQILETKKELEDNRREAFSPETPGHRRVPLEQAFGGDVGRKKEKELIQKDVEKLTSSIQALTRSVNPLAKMLDYLQEDFDSMQKELENWRKENKTLSQNLNAEQSLTDQQLEPLKTQLQEMESAIYDQHDRISAIKAIILRNDEKISRLLGGINVKA